MPYTANRSGHRALKALAESPRTMSELRDIINPNAPVRSIGKVVSMRADGLIWPGREEFVITDIGREALAVLDAGEAYNPVRTGVRIFVSSQGAGMGGRHPTGAC